jgi:hypothetical protein
MRQRIRGLKQSVVIRCDKGCRRELRQQQVKLGRLDIWSADDIAKTSVKVGGAELFAELLSYKQQFVAVEVVLQVGIVV